MGGAHPTAGRLVSCEPGSALACPSGSVGGSGCCSGAGVSGRDRTVQRGNGVASQFRGERRGPFPWCGTLALALMIARSSARDCLRGVSRTSRFAVRETAAAGGVRARPGRPWARRWQWGWDTLGKPSRRRRGRESWGVSRSSRFAVRETATRGVRARPGRSWARRWQWGWDTLGKPSRRRRGWEPWAVSRVSRFAARETATRAVRARPKSGSGVVTTGPATVTGIRHCEARSDEAIPRLTSSGGSSGGGLPRRFAPRNDRSAATIPVTVETL
jgi:hypothetical protein